MPTPVGDTPVEPTGLDVVPMPLSINTLCISLPPQVRVAVLPERVEAGETVMVQEGPPTGGGGGGGGGLVLIVTTVVQVATCPVGLATVPVKVVSDEIAFDVVVPEIAGE